MSVKIRPYRRRGKECGFEVDIAFKWPDGERYRERVRSPVSSRSGSKAWAEQRLGELLRKGKHVVLVEAAAPTLRVFAPKYIESAKADRQKPSTIIQKERIIAHYLMPRFGDRPIDTLNAEDEQNLKAALLSLAPKTINNIVAVMNGIRKDAHRLGVLKNLPPAWKSHKVPLSVVPFYDPLEYERLVASAVAIAPQLLLFVLLGGEAGLRCGEIIALEWSDIDFDRGLIHVRRSEWEGHVTVPKGGRARQVNMTARLAQALRANRHLKHDRVLWRDDARTKVTQVLMAKWMRRIQRRAGLKVTGGIHILRHTFCSRLAIAGASTMAIKELAGHQNISTTQRYMHLSPSAKSAAIELLNGNGSSSITTGPSAGLSGN